MIVLLEIFSFFQCSVLKLWWKNNHIPYMEIFHCFCIDIFFLSLPLTYTLSFFRLSSFSKRILLYFLLWAFHRKPLHCNGREGGCLFHSCWWHWHSSIKVSSFTLRVIYVHYIQTQNYTYTINLTSWGWWAHMDISNLNAQMCQTCNIINSYATLVQSLW